MWDERFTSKLFLFSKGQGGVLRTAFMISGALLLSSCDGKTDLQVFCEALPQSESDVIAFQAELTPYVPAPTTGRRLASLNEGKERPSPSLRGQWFQWTERALKRTQWARDALETDHKSRPARQLLSETSLSLVSLHGYIDQQKWRKASAELAKIDDRLRQVHALACPKPSQ